MIDFEVYLHLVFFDCIIHVLFNDIHNLIKYLWIIIANRATYMGLVSNDVKS